MAASGEFDVFVVVCSPGLLRLAYSLTHDHGLAEDLLQTSLVKVWGAWRRLDGDPLPYARRVLVDTYVSAWRRRWRHEVPTEEADLDVGSSPPDDHGVGERDEVWRALGALPRRQRAVLVLRYLEDLSEQDSAAVLGVGVGTVKSQASKGLARLRIDPSFAPSTDSPVTCKEG